MKNLGSKLWDTFKRMAIPWFVMLIFLNRFIDPVLISNLDSSPGRRFAMYISFLLFIIAYFSAWHYVTEIVKYLWSKARR